MQMGKIYICAAVLEADIHVMCHPSTRHVLSCLQFPFTFARNWKCVLWSISCTCVVCCITLHRQRVIHDCMNSVICKYMYALHIGSKSMLPFFFLIGREFHQGISTWAHFKYQNTQPEAMHALIPISRGMIIFLSLTQCTGPQGRANQLQFVLVALPGSVI